MFNTLSAERLKQVVPSVFTENGAEGTSDKYQHISTAKVVDALLAEGFMPTQAMQCNCRKPDNKAYTKHLLRFRHVDARPTASGLFPEIVLINSHDGLSSYRLIVFFPYNTSFQNIFYVLKGKGNCELIQQPYGSRYQFVALTSPFKTQFYWLFFLNSLHAIISF